MTVVLVTQCGSSATVRQPPSDGHSEADVVLSPQWCGQDTTIEALSRRDSKKGIYNGLWCRASSIQRVDLARRLQKIKGKRGCETPKTNNREEV